MTPDARKAWAGNLLSGGLLATLYGGDVAEHLRIQSAEVYAVSVPPLLPLAAGVLGLLALCVGVAVVGLVQRRGASWRGYRLLPILAVLALFLDLFVIHGNADRVPSDDRLQGQLEAFAAAASLSSRGQQVVTDARVLQGLAEELGRPPYLFRGKPVEAFRVEVQTGCAGPRPPPEGAPVGTLLYCVSPDGTQAWTSAVALPDGIPSGPPAPFTRGGGLVALRVSPAPPAPLRDPETGEPLGEGEPPEGN